MNCLFVDVNCFTNNRGAIRKPNGDILKTLESLKSEHIVIVPQIANGSFKREQYPAWFDTVFTVSIPVSPENNPLRYHQGDVMIEATDSYFSIEKVLGSALFTKSKNVVFKRLQASFHPGKGRCADEQL